MKIVSLMAAGLLLAAFAAEQPAHAQSGCADIDFTSSITDRFPNARNACLGIETREGRQFAHFQAEIVRVSGNQVRARFLRPDGSYSETFAFDMDAGDRVEVGGRSYRYRELSRGQQLDIYVPNDRWEFHIPEEDDFSVARTVAVAMPYEADTGGEGAMLPQTAGPLPLLGLAGVLLTAAGLALAAIRRWLA
jgi:hypothetical protein